MKESCTCALRSTEVTVFTAENTRACGAICSWRVPVQTWSTTPPSQSDHSVMPEYRGSCFTAGMMQHFLLAIKIQIKAAITNILIY